MKIAVFGSMSEIVSDEINNLSYNIGKEISLQGHTLVTGGCYGIPYEAVKGAYETEGRIIGFSPTYSLEQHILEKNPSNKFSELIFLKSEQKSLINSISTTYSQKNEFLNRETQRDSLLVNYIDAGIVIRGGIGTNAEYSLMLRFGKIIGVVLNTGGIADSIVNLNERLKNGTAKNHLFLNTSKKKIDWINEHNYEKIFLIKDFITKITDKYNNH